MKLKKHLAVLLSAGIILSCTSGAYCAPISKPMVVSAAYETQINKIVELVNQQRAAKGIAPVTASPLMMQAAAARVQELTKTFSSKRPNGESGINILKEYGVVFSQGGENIAVDFDTPAEVMEAWGENSNQQGRILNSAYHFIGVGVTYSGGSMYWVQLFADSTGESEETTPTETETTPTETTTTTTTTTSTTTSTTPETTTTTTTSTTPETTTTTTTSTTPETTTTTTTSTTPETTTTTTTSTTPATTTTTTTSTTPATTTTTTTSTTPATTTTTTTSTTPVTTTTTTTSTTPETTTTTTTSTTPATTTTTTTSTTTTSTTSTTPVTTTTTTTSSTLATTTTTTTSTIETEPVQTVVQGLGDVDYINGITAKDAADVLKYAAIKGANGWSIFGDDQEKRADVNSDGTGNSTDAAMILKYVAYVGTGGEKTIYEYFGIG